MTRMTAIFHDDTVDRLLPLYRAECTRFGHDFDLTPSRVHTLEGWDAAVTGPAQHVMFFIGFAANSGEDGIISVNAA